MFRINDVRALLTDEGACWERIQELRRVDLLQSRNRVSVKSRANAVIRGSEIVREIVEILLGAGLDFGDMDPAHNLGHMVRDYLNALRLFSGQDAPPADLFIGLLGGALHDLGCAVVSRYDENRRVIRHAEAAAILLDELFKQKDVGLNRDEQALVEYGVAAHTNYMTPSTVNCADGVTRTVEPYPVEADGRPVYGVIFPKFVDRLDCNGPAFVGRHYIGLGEKHEDFSGGEFHTIEYSAHMRPLLRPLGQPIPKGEGTTMLEHFRGFLVTQTEASPYGRYDYGEMIRMRDKQSARLARVVQAVVEPQLPEPGRMVEEAWTRFLNSNVEPTVAGIRAADYLADKFSRLSPETRVAWRRGFLTAMVEYCDWASEADDALTAMPHEWLQLRPAVDDIAAFIRPHTSWREMAEVSAAILQRGLTADKPAIDD